MKSLFLVLVVLLGTNAAQAATPTACSAADADGLWAISGATQNGLVFAGYLSFYADGSFYQGWVSVQRLNGKKQTADVTTGGFVPYNNDCVFNLAAFTGDGVTKLNAYVAMSASREVAIGPYTAASGRSKYQGILNMVKVP